MAIDIGAGSGRVIRGTWNEHGATAAGHDALEAFDRIDVANKGAAILLKCLSSGFEPEGMSATEMAAFEKEFHL